MRIALLNGSPKAAGSASGALLEELKRGLSRQELAEVHLRTGTVSEQALAALDSADVWVFACPLYVDGIPSQLLSCLVQLEELGGKGVRVYGIVNCGFYEGVQAEFALEILEHWCAKAGAVWSGGIGVGGGGGLDRMPDPGPGRGPKAPVQKAVQEMANALLRQEALKNQYVSVGIPRFLYQMGAQLGWRQAIRANGGKKKDLGKRPE